MTNRLFDLMSRSAPAPERAFLVEPSGRATSYGAFFERSGRLANALAARGVEPGDRVAVQVEKSVDALALYVACLRAGAVYLPLNSAYTPAEISYFIADASPRLFVCAPDQLQSREKPAREAGAGCVETFGAEGDGSLLRSLDSYSAEGCDRPRAASDLAAILYTSGTTGRSKGAMLTHENLASNAQALVGVWRFRFSDVLLHALPIYHTHGLFVATNTVLLSGASMIFLPQFNVDEVIEHLPQATVMMGVPTYYVRLLQRPELTADLVKSMRLFISGSAPLLEETHRAWRARTGHAILERYGMTETNMNTSNPYEGERRPGSVGFPLPGIDLRIARPETGEPMARGEIGMIEVRGPNVFCGYWNMPEKTASEFRADGFFITGDLGNIDEDGYVHIVGRGKDLIITGGLNVYPKEVEAQIDSIEGVDESAVIGLPHPDFGEGVAAVVVRRPGSGVTAEAIRAVLDARLAKFKQPKAFFFAEDLPRNAMGKVQKNALREAYWNFFSDQPTARSERSSRA